MNGWQTFAIATGPAAVTGITALAGIRASSRTARDALTADVGKARLERVHDRLQVAYIDLVEAERKLSYQAAGFTWEDYREWNDKSFRPAVSAVYVLGSAEVRRCIDALLGLYRDAQLAAAADVEHVDEADQEIDLGYAMAARLDENHTDREALREQMIDAMRTDLEEELERIAPMSATGGRSTG